MKLNTRTNKRKVPKGSSELARWFLDAVQPLFPVADGSLSLRKSSCVRANCRACAAGEGHRSYVLYGRSAKKRFSVYVPQELVEDIRKALENGRRLKDLMSEAGLRYTHLLKDERNVRISAGKKGGADAGQ